MEIERIACNSCGSGEFAALSPSGATWTIGRCTACGLVFVNPMPFFEPDDSFAEMSRGFEYTEYMHQPISDDILAFERRQLAAMGEELAWRGGPARTTERISFVDLGCGSGAGVKAANDLGWQAVGVDLDPQLVAEGREQLGVDLRCARILDSGLPQASFDFVRLRDVIEHLPNPLEILSYVRGLLAPGGVLLVVTPNEGGLATEVRTALRQPRRLVATVPPPHHLHSFGPGTLEGVVRRAGLHPLNTFTTAPTDWRYVTSHNLARAQAHPWLRPLWRVAKAAGAGAVLVSWVGQ